MKLTLRIWRQKDTTTRGRFVTYQIDGVTPDMSFLEMLDVLNEQLVEHGEEPVAFEHDCREGICGSCGFLIDGVPHGPRRHTTVCQLHMRFFKDGDALTLEPWRARAFPIVRDLVVDRSAFDRIIRRLVPLHVMHDEHGNEERASARSTGVRRCSVEAGYSGQAGEQQRREQPESRHERSLAVG